MPRKQPSLLDSLVVLPWWVSVVTAVVAYLALAMVFPALTADNQYASMVAQGLANFAGFLAFILLLPAPFSFLRQLKAKQLLNRQSDLASISALSWQQFESLLAEYFRRQGYLVLENVGGGPDGGVDLRLKKDGRMHLVQCKHWKTFKVGVAVVREMYGVSVAERAASMMIVTSGEFTEEAKAFARGKPLVLIEGQQLIRMIAAVQPAQDNTSLAEPLPIGSDLAATPSSQLCPRCDAELVLRTAKRGTHAGNQFYGCSNFPRCRYTQSAAQG